jgi:hypothetical protein
MKLIDAVRKLDSLDDNATIYAAKPWSPTSEIVVAEEREAGGEPPEASAKGMTYLLEVFLVKEIIDGFASIPGRKTTDAEKCERLINYAIHDA